MKGNSQWQILKNYSIANILNYHTSTLNLYSGTAPIAANDFLESTYSTNLVVSFSIQTSSFLVDTDTKIATYMRTFPGPATSVQAATISWFALVLSGSASLFPYIIGGVTLNNGNGICKMLTTSTTDETPYDIYSFAFKLITT